MGELSSPESLNLWPRQQFFSDCYSEQQQHPGRINGLKTGNTEEIGFNPIFLLLSLLVGACMADFCNLSTFPGMGSMPRHFPYRSQPKLFLITGSSMLQSGKAAGQSTAQSRAAGREHIKPLSQNPEQRLGRKHPELGSCPQDRGPCGFLLY